MKLLSMYIESFGTLSDYKQDFNAGINNIKAENGWGKTTVTMFIKAMLYGLSTKEREKYTPWKSLNSFGGSIIFEYNNKNYRIDRSFDPKKPSLDTVAFYDLSINKKVKAPDNIGEKILNLNESSFERSVFIPERDLESKFNSDIENKLRSIIGGTPDEADFDEAIKILKNREESLIFDEKKGIISDKREELEKLDEEITENNDSVRKIPDISQNILLLDDEREYLINKRKDINAKIVEYGKNQERMSKLDLLAKYDKDIEESEAALAANNQIFNGIAITQDDINEYRAKYKRFESLRLEYNLKKNTKAVEITQEVSKLINDTNIPTDEDLKSIENKIDKLKSIKTIMEAHQEQKKKKFGIFGKGDDSNIGGHVKSYDFEKNTLTEEIREYFSKYHLYTSDFSNNLYILKTSKEKYLDWKKDYEFATIGAKKIENEIKMLENDILHFLGQFQTTAPTVEERIGELNTHIRNQNDLFSALMKKRDYRKYFVSENDLENIKAVNYDLDKLNAELSEIDNQVSTILANKRDLERELSSLEGLQYYIDDLYESKEELVEEIKSLEEEYRLVKLAYNYLIKSEKSLLERYTTPMKTSVNKYIDIMFKNKSFNIDSNLNFSFKTTDGMKNIGDYGKGYQAIISLCMRLALIDCLYPNEKPFVILDDPFATLDDEKLELCKKLIRGVSSNYQIIYYTCHKSRLIE